jgi:hypothetical protein
LKLTASELSVFKVFKYDSYSDGDKSCILNVVGYTANRLKPVSVPAFALAKFYSQTQTATGRSY